MAAISQMTYLSAFYWMKMYDILLIFHWDIFLGIVNNILSFFFQIMAWRRPGGKPFSELFARPSVCAIEPVIYTLDQGTIGVL